MFAVFIILLGFVRQAEGAAFFLFFAGFGVILFFSIGNSIIQTQSPDHLRGRLMGIWALVFGGSLPAVASGWASSLSGWVRVMPYRRAAFSALWGHPPSIC